MQCFFNVYCKIVGKCLKNVNNIIDVNPIAIGLLY